MLPDMALTPHPGVLAAAAKSTSDPGAVWISGASRMLAIRLPQVIRTQFRFLDQAYTVVSECLPIRVSGAFRYFAMYWHRRTDMGREGARSVLITMPVDRAATARIVWRKSSTRQRPPEFCRFVP